GSAEPQHIAVIGKRAAGDHHRRARDRRTVVVGYMERRRERDGYSAFDIGIAPRRIADHGLSEVLCEGSRATRTEPLKRIRPGNGNLRRAGRRAIRHPEPVETVRATTPEQHLAAELAKAGRR